MLQCNIERREDWNKELNHDDPFSPSAFELRNAPPRWIGLRTASIACGSAANEQMTAAGYGHKTRPAQIFAEFIQR